MNKKNAPETLASLFQMLREREAARLDLNGVAALLVDVKRHCRALEASINDARAGLSAQYSEVQGVVLGGSKAVVGVALYVAASTYMHAPPAAFTFEMRVDRDGVHVTAGSGICRLSGEETTIERLEALLASEIWGRLPGKDA